MSRLNQVSDAQASTEVAAVFDAIKGKIGMVPNLYRVAANEPAVLKGLLGLNDTLSTGVFDARTREAIALTVAGANSCDYCASAHSAISAALKVSDAEIDAHLSGQSADPKLRAILTLTTEIVSMQGQVRDDAVAAARAGGLDDGEITEVVANVVANIFTNYLNHVAQTDIDFPVKSATAA
ncbi:carboxymuconolactone decarboxylase family protein [Roseobacter sp. YSTF-M11]|uniref:Carboxymuconolactone decarboxylase family protein n=1 Tax=Roseobacter insulae TaxID=2859783 RepID=A0A9X1K2C9_9RHOB|nr:carboxymuconolactone decarboxylase family protein [Roseobacter insulae]MBW4707442.1 carboxymuconolactone decarboxylase family protein [Roseobacter insulae]